MLTFVYYLVKVMLCSSILFGYYWLALRNKKFHLYNRFYLLASVLLSWLIPLMRIDFFKETSQQTQIVKLLAAVAGGNQFVQEATNRNVSAWDWNVVLVIAFAFISALFTARLLITVVRIIRLISSRPVQRWKQFYFVFTNAKGTPFSFFKYIFWNEEIDLQSLEGELILKHELVHVQEKHSADKMFLNVVLIAGWYNPVMWLISKELNMLHEFIADEKAIEDGDTVDFATMLLKAAFPQHSFPLVNSFFYSPLKRRLVMLTTSKKTSYSYLRRVAVLPLLSVTFILFAFTLKKAKATHQSYNSFRGDRIIEQEILMDTEEEKTEVPYFQDTTKKKNSKLNGSNDKTIEFSNVTITRGDGNVVQISADTILVSKDTGKLRNELIVLDGTLTTWEDLKGMNPSEISTMTILKDQTATDKYGEKGKNGVIEITTSSIKNENHELQNLKARQDYIQTKLKYQQEQMIEGAAKKQNLQQQQYLKEQLQNLKDQQNLLAKQHEYQKEQLGIDKVFTRVENPPYYSKGMKGFADYISSNMRYPREAIQNKIEGAVLIQFIVSGEGKLTDFKKLSGKGYGLEEEAIRLIKNSGDWKPGIQNGHTVPVQIEQQIIFELPKNS